MLFESSVVHLYDLLFSNEPIIVASVARLIKHFFPVIHMHVGQGSQIPFHHPFTLLLRSPGVHGDEGLLAGNSLNLTQRLFAPF